MGRSLPSVRDFAVQTTTERVVYNYTKNHHDHNVSLVKPLSSTRAFLVARGPVPSVDDIVMVSHVHNGIQRLARYQVEQIRGNGDGWRAYCRTVQNP